MPSICPECGAILDEGQSCQAIFDAFLALELTDPGYGAVHMLTVACFMIQHERYSDEALTWIEEKLRDHLEQGVPTDHIRRRAARETNQGSRTWKVLLPADAPARQKIAWSMTIADVAASYHDAENYRALVRQWAGVTLREMSGRRERSFT